MYVCIYIYIYIYTYIHIYNIYTFATFAKTFTLVKTAYFLDILINKKDNEI